MINTSRIIFIHGSESNSQTKKATILRNIFPAIVIPDFTGSLKQRMLQLKNIIGHDTGWTIIGSSLGGLMAALFAAGSPGQVQRLVLLAPALTLPEFSEHLRHQIPIPTAIIHGTRDDIVSLEEVRELAEMIFPNLAFFEVDDDHRLHKTAETLDWRGLLEGQHPSLTIPLL